MRLRQLSTCLAVAALIAPLACGPSKARQTTVATPSEPTGDPNAPTVSSIPTVMTADPGTGPAVAMVTKTAVEPKPLSQTVKKGLAWLASHQLSGGGWGQGDEAPNMRQQTGRSSETANVADTSMALIAFLRAGHTPRAGEHQNTVHRGIEYVLSQIEASDTDSLYVTGVRGTRIQSKIGVYADTFAALMLLTEAREQMRDGVANARLDAALKKVVKKIEKNQRANGSFDDQGWAPVLSQALAAKGLNRAAQNGAQVSKQVLDRIEANARAAETTTGSAGVEVYGTSAKSGAIRDTAVRKKAKADDMKAKKAAYDNAHKSPNVPTAAEIAAADEEAKVSHKEAVENERKLIARLDDSRFIAGFGNNGGEEFLSYLLISETLVQRGDEDWKRWDNAIAKLVNRVQNEDGSWTGHHCITGRTFCTAAALLVLMGDRTPAVTAVIAK
jgi:hypothetical protein